MEGNNRKEILMSRLTESDFMTVSQLKVGGGWEGRYISAIGLIPTIKKIDGNLRCLEIGVCRGENIVKFLEECPNIEHFDAVDPYIEYDDDNGGMSKDLVDRMRDIAIKNFNAFPGKVTLHTMTSKEYSNKVEDDHYDYIFVDGNHSYDYVLEDIQMWYPKLKKGGVFAGHDFYLECVRKAVYDYRIKNKVFSMLHNCDHSVWWWSK